jgi:tripartite-type tricarboxylate transporter receptor subunit TctC
MSRRPLLRWATGLAATLLALAALVLWLNLRGEAPLAPDPSPPVAAAHVKSGKLRALAASSAKRTPLAPDVPTVAESGVPGFDMVTWWGAVVPAKTPAPIIERLNVTLRKSLEFADTLERFAALGIDVQSSTPAAFRSFMAAELARYAKLSKQVGLKNE